MPKISSKFPLDKAEGKQYIIASHASVAQWIECLPPEQEAAGSNPTRRISILSQKILLDSSVRRGVK